MQREYSAGEEIAHTITHGLGFLLSIAGLSILVVFASLNGNAWHIAGCSIYGGTLVFLFTASTLYHSLPHSRAKRVFRFLDHSAIYLLIAGTYTPFTLVNLRGGWGWTLFGLVWGLALFGIVLQVASKGRTNAASLALYLTLGWLAIVGIKPLFESVEAGGLWLMFLGGMAFTGGVVFYAWRRLRYHHAVWHLFVMTGTICHFFAVLFFVIP